MPFLLNVVGSILHHLILAYKLSMDPLRASLVIIKSSSNPTANTLANACKNEWSKSLQARACTSLFCFLLASRCPTFAWQKAWKDYGSCIGVNWAVQSLWSSWGSIWDWNWQGAWSGRPRHSVPLPQEEHTKYKACGQDNSYLAFAHGSIVWRENCIHPKGDRSSTANSGSSQYLRMSWMFRRL